MITEKSLRCFSYSCMAIYGNFSTGNFVVFAISGAWQYTVYTFHQQFINFFFLHWLYLRSTYWPPHPIIYIFNCGGKFQASRLMAFKHIHLLWHWDDQTLSSGVRDCVCFPKQSPYTLATWWLQSHPTGAFIMFLNLAASHLSSIS